MLGAGANPPVGRAISASPNDTREVKMSKVFVYRNLRKKCWSVRDVKSGLVIKHADHILLADATFKVSEAGRQRVLRQKRKNVHAGILGVEVSLEHPAIPSFPVSYNPYKGPKFFVVETGEPIETAKLVELDSMGKVFV